jgi:hypothetical protein
MKKIVILLFISFVALAFVASIASAQDGTAEDPGNGMTVTIKNSMPISATLDVIVDGKLVRVTVPVQLSINTQTTIDSENFANAPIDLHK